MVSGVRSEEEKILDKALGELTKAANELDRAARLDVIEITITAIVNKEIRSVREVRSFLEQWQQLLKT